MILCFHSFNPTKSHNIMILYKRVFSWIYKLLLEAKDVPLSHSLSYSSTQRGGVQEILVLSNNLATWSKSAQRQYTSPMPSTSQHCPCLQAYQSLSALFHTCTRCLQRFPSTVDYVIAGSSKQLNWLGTFNYLVQTEGVTSPLSSGLISWKSSQGWGFNNPEHAPISARTFCTLLLPETLVCPGHWPAFGKALKKKIIMV